MGGRYVALVLTIIVGSVPTVVHAERPEDKAWAKVGGYLPNVDTEVSIARPGEEDFTTLIDLEQDLDLSDRDTLPTANVGVRLGKNWRVEGEIYSLRRSGQRQLDTEIVFDGVTYPISAELRSRFTTDIYRVSVGYSFLRRDNLELGAAIGLHGSNFKIALQGAGTINGETTEGEVRRREVFAPLPTVGLYGTYMPSQSVALHGRIDYLSLKVGDYDGKLTNIDVGASYAIAKRFRLGASYRYVDYRLDILKEDYTGRIKHKFSGPVFFAELAF